jgi:hypothetical protein
MKRSKAVVQAACLSIRTAREARPAALFYSRLHIQRTSIRLGSLRGAAMKAMVGWQRWVRKLAESAAYRWAPMQWCQRQGRVSPHSELASLDRR